MKRVISCLMALVMLVSALPVVPAEAATPVTMSETALGLSDDSSFGRLLNNSLPAEEPAEEELESLIHALDFGGKTASVILTVPRASRLVVAIYDETTDAMFASGTLDVVPGEEQQEVTVQIEIDTMPEYFRGKALLLDKNTMHLCRRSSSMKNSPRVIRRSQIPNLQISWKNPCTVYQRVGQLL